MDNETLPSQLSGHSFQVEDPPDTLSTGLSVLDESLGGGIAAGNIVAIKAPAESSAEQLGYALARERSHPTLYLSTFRPPEHIEADIEAADQGVGTSEIHGDVCSIRREEHNQGLFADFGSRVGEFQGGSVVVDMYSDWADTAGRWEEGLPEFAKFLRSSQGIAYLYLRAGDGAVNQRINDRVVHIADTVFEYSVGESEQSADRLRIPKARRIQDASTTLPIEHELNVSRGVEASRGETFR